MADTKRCTRCDKTKPVDEFGKNSWALDDRQYWCKACMAEHRREKYKDPVERERQRKRAREWNAANSERYKANVKKWRAENPERRRELQKRWRDANPERARYLRRRSWIKRKYGLTVEVYDEMIAGGCAICGSTTRVHMDHNHTTGKVRAALCENCNRGLGLFAENPERLRAGATYLEHHSAA